jgi:hypothetical protein
MFNLTIVSYLPNNQLDKINKIAFIQWPLEVNVDRLAMYD